jgi:hypothetical protein
LSWHDRNREKRFTHLERDNVPMNKRSQHSGLNLGVGSYRYPKKRDEKRERTFYHRKWR